MSSCWRKCEPRPTRVQRLVATHEPPSANALQGPACRGADRSQDRAPPPICFLKRVPLWYGRSGRGHHLHQHSLHLRTWLAHWSHCAPWMLQPMRGQVLHRDSEHRHGPPLNPSAEGSLAPETPSEAAVPVQVHLASCRNIAATARAPQALLVLQQQLHTGSLRPQGLGATQGRRKSR